MENTNRERKRERKKERKGKLRVERGRFAGNDCSLCR